MDRRARPREWVLWDGKLHVDGGTLECEIFDVSAEGAKVRVETPMMANAEVVLEIGRLGRFPGEVRWHTAKEAGIRFLERADTIEDRFRGTGDASILGSQEELSESGHRPARMGTVDQMSRVNRPASDTSRPKRRRA